MTMDKADVESDFTIAIRTQGFFFGLENKNGKFVDFLLVFYLLYFDIGLLLWILLKVVY